MLCLSWRKRACVVIRKAVLRLGNLPACFRVSSRALCPAIAMPSKCGQCLRRTKCSQAMMRSNVDTLFQQHTYLMFPSKAIHTDGIRAGMMVKHSHVFLQQRLI